MAPHLPDELFLQIFQFLEERFLLRVARVSKLLYRISADDSLWRPFWNDLVGTDDEESYCFDESSVVIGHNYFLYDALGNELMRSPASPSSSTRVYDSFKQRVANYHRNMNKSDEKIVLIGDSGSGKTSLAYRYTNKKKPPVIPGFYGTQCIDVLYHGKLLTLSMCDTEMWGSNEYETEDSGENHGLLRRRVFNDTDVFLICLSVAQPGDPAALEWAVKRWSYELLFYANSAPRILAITKNDLRHSSEQHQSSSSPSAVRLLPQDECARLAKLIQAPYLECSAWTGENVNKVIETCLDVMFSYREHHMNILKQYQQQQLEKLTTPEQQEKEQAAGQPEDYECAAVPHPAMTRCNIRPLNDTILVQKFAPLEPNSIACHVIAVGPGRRTKKGKLIPITSVKVGDVVIVSEYTALRRAAGVKLWSGGSSNAGASTAVAASTGVSQAFQEEFGLFKEKDILAVVQEIPTSAFTSAAAATTGRAAKST